MKPLRVFIASAVQDLSFAQDLRTQLAAAGLQPSLSQFNLSLLQPGLQAGDETGVLIRQSDAVVLLLSPYLLESLNVRQEWELARRLHKPVLLLLIHSLSPVDLLTAMEPCLPGVSSPPDGDLLQWLDIRRQPSEAAWLTLGWLRDRSGAHHGLTPGPVEPARFYTEVIPPPARRIALVQIALAAWGIPIVLGIMLRLVVAQIGPVPAIFMDQFLGSLLTGACAVSMLLLAHVGWNGIKTFQRRGRPPGDVLRPLQYTLLGVAFLLFILGVASQVLGKTAFLHETLFPDLSMLCGLICAFLAAGLFLPGILANRSRQLRLWLPRLDLAELQPISDQEAPSPSEAIEAPIPANRTRRAPYPPEGSWISLTRWLRSVFPVNPVQPAFATAQAGFKLIQALDPGPGYHVSVLSAPQDAPFARSLERYLHENGLKVQEDVAASVNAHVNARIQFDSTKTREDGAVVLVLSPWTKENVAVGEYVQSAQIAGTPILPVLLEDTSIPSEFGGGLWVDARRDLMRARQQVLEAVLGQRKKASPASHPRLEPNPMKRSAVRPRHGLIPDSVQLAQWGLFFSSVFKLVILAILFPMTLWMNSPLTTGDWLSAGLIFSVTYIQLIAVVLFFMRRLSYPWMILVQLDCLLVSLVTLPFMQSDLFWPVSPLSHATLIFPIWEAAVLGWLVFVVEIREWALGSFWVRLRNLKISPSIKWISLAPLMIGLLFLLPAFKTGPQPQLRQYAGQLLPGETVLVQIQPPVRPETWTFQASAGELVTIRLDGGFSSALLQFSLSRGSRLLAESRSTLGGAIVSSLRLPEDGEYTLHLADLPSEGLFRLSLSLERPEMRSLPCDSVGNVKPQFATLQPGQSLGWMVPIAEGENLHLRVDAQTWKLDPWMRLYDSAGNLVAASENSGMRASVTIPNFYASKPGPYYLITHSHPGTSGKYKLLCSHTDK